MMQSVMESKNGEEVDVFIDPSTQEQKAWPHSLFKCPECPSSFSNATGAWQHFFMWHGEDILIDTVREWRVEVNCDKEEDEEGQVGLDDGEGQAESPGPFKSGIEEGEREEETDGFLVVHDDDAMKSTVIPNDEDFQTKVDTSGLNKINCVLDEKETVTTQLVLDNDDNVKKEDVAKLSEPSSSNICDLGNEEEATTEDELNFSLDEGSSKTPNAQQPQHKTGQEKVKCAFCSQILPKGTIKVHARVHDGGTIPCLVEGCGGLFRAKFNLRDHTNRAHRSPCKDGGVYGGSGGPLGLFNYRKVDCPGCCAKVGVNIIQSHIRWNHPSGNGCEEGPTFICVDCSGTFLSKNGLARHRSEWHKKTQDN